MNVVQTDKQKNSNMRSKFRNEFVKRDESLGIRGATSFLHLYNSNMRAVNKGPRYEFNDNDTIVSSKRSMGPPVGIPHHAKRRIIYNSTSTKPESSSSGKIRPKVLASDSAVAETSNDFCTPRNRPTAFTYISSSSRGGYNGNRSVRSTSISVVEASVILAISEGRGKARGEVGIAAIDLRHPHLVLCQFSDTLLYTHTLTKINYFNPIEIIVPNTFYEGVQPNQLFKIIKDQFPHVKLNTFPRKQFNDEAGRKNINTLCAPQYSAVCLQVFQKFYALTSAAAVLKYVEHIQCIVFAKESLKIEYHSSENTMIIDVATASQLELVQPLVPSAGSTCCLLGVLGPTYTISGIRALRAGILQPSCNKDFIEARLDSVQDLIENDSGLMVDLQDILKKLSDIDKILLLCVESTNQNTDKLGEAQLNQLLLLKTTMNMIPTLVEALNTAESAKLKKIKLDLEHSSYNDIAERIKNVIQEDAHLEKGAMGCLQRCFAIKPNINGLLDVARRTYSELIDDMQKIVEHLSETHELPIRLNQNIIKGFHIVLPIAPKNRRHFIIEDLPTIFIQVRNSGASVTMTTEELVVLDHQAKESLNEIQKLSNVVIYTLLKDLRPFMSSLYKLCENVAELDVLLALAQSSSIGQYIRPEFNSYLDIKNSLHPLLEYNSQVMPIPNDIFASPEYNLTIITGPNMGGKSIYIKQIAIIQIMAQLGCFLPATNAILRICNRLFSRIGFNDNAELNVSTFVLEMKELQHILKGLTSSSLVIIDELCRGTSSEEGASIAWSICEELILSDAFTFFTTHFMYLTRLQDLYHSVVNLHTVVTEECNEVAENPQKRLVYRHKIEPGVTTVERYGLYLASQTNLPCYTVKLAEELADFITRNKTSNKLTTLLKNDEKEFYNLNAKIKLESRKTNSDDKIEQLIKKFKQDNPQIIQLLKIQENTTNVAGNATSSCSGTIDVNHESSDKTIRKSTNESIYINTSQNNANIRINNCVNNNYNLVKSSNELLHSVINSTNKDLENIDEQNKMDHDVTYDDSFSYIGTHEVIEKISTNSSNLQNNEDDSSDDVVDSVNNAQDIDIENEMTQVRLGEHTVHELSSCSQISDQTMSVIDEEFIMKTVNEINEELLIMETNPTCSDNLILTPPMEFRD